MRSASGAVNFVTKRPDFSRRRSEALVSLGSLPNGRAALGTTGPRGNGDRAAYRADIVFSKSAGHIDDNDTRAVNVSGAVDLKLTAAATLSVSADHFGDDYSTGYWGTPLIAPSIAREPTDAVSDARGLVLDKSCARSTTRRMMPFCVRTARGCARGSIGDYRRSGPS